LILVTVGSTSFDPLIEAIDSLSLKERVIAQIGYGRYIPKNVEHFRFIESLDKLIDKADVVITTGGAAIIFECLKKGKKIIAVENTKVSGSHQKELLYKLHKEKHIFWCRDILHIFSYLKWFKTGELVPFQPEQLDLNLVLLSLFAEDKKPWWRFWNR